MLSTLREPAAEGVGADRSSVNPSRINQFAVPLSPHEQPINRVEAGVSSRFHKKRPFRHKRLSRACHDQSLAQHLRPFLKITFCRFDEDPTG
jgi:hypothetical protein